MALNIDEGTLDHAAFLSNHGYGPLGLLILVELLILDATHVCVQLGFATS